MVKVNQISGQEVVRVNRSESPEVPEVTKFIFIEVSQVRLHTSIPMPA